MRRLNLLHHKTSRRRLWTANGYAHGKLPEIIMEGSHVIHTDEDGNILLDNEGDQRLRKKQLEFQEFDEIFQRMQEDPNGIGREQMAEFLRDEYLKDEAVMSERMQELFGIGASKK